MEKDFIANAAHELRTPITIIRGYAETLQDLPDVSREMLHEIAGKIVRTCDRLDRLTRSLLTLTDIEHFSKEKLKKTDLISIAENCSHIILDAHPSIQITLKKDLDIAPILGDPDLIELAILNLLENGVKYSEGLAVLEMCIEQKESDVLLSVKDRGIGIQESDIPHIFKRFYRVNRSPKLSGSGLGLSIVKMILEKHKGSVFVESKLGKESTFTLSLPLQVDVFP